MNRAERRKTIKEKPNELLTTQQLKEAERDGTRKAIRLYSVAVAWNLYNKLGLENDQICEVVDSIIDTFDSIGKDYVAFEDLIQTMESEGGLNLRKDLKNYPS